MTANPKWFPARNEQGVVGRFEYYPLLDIPESQKEDKEVFKDIVVLRTKAGGSSDESVQKVKPWNQQQFIDRFPDAWRSFQGERVMPEGVMLKEIGMGEDLILKLSISGIDTCEQLRDTSDAIVQGLGFGFRTWREKAITLLKDREKAAMDRVLKSAEPVSGDPSPEPVKRRPGRPPKNAVAA